MNQDRRERESATATYKFVTAISGPSSARAIARAMLGQASKYAASDADERQCRICFESDATVEDPMIAPCRYAGSVAWVHVRCLEEWRGQESVPLAFSRCPQCHFFYVLESDESISRMKYVALAAFVARDTAAVFLVLQSVLAVTALALHAMPFAEDLKRLYPSEWAERTYALHFFIGPYCTPDARPHSTPHILEPPSPRLTRRPRAARCADVSACLGWFVLIGVGGPIAYLTARAHGRSPRLSSKRPPPGALEAAPPPMPRPLPLPSELRRGVLPRSLLRGLPRPLRRVRVWQLRVRRLCVRRLPAWQLRQRCGSCAGCCAGVSADALPVVVTAALLLALVFALVGLLVGFFFATVTFFCSLVYGLFFVFSSWYRPWYLPWSIRALATARAARATRPNVSHPQHGSPARQPLPPTHAPALPPAPATHASPTHAPAALSGRLPGHCAAELAAALHARRGERAPSARPLASARVARATLRTRGATGRGRTIVAPGVAPVVRRLRRPARAARARAGGGPPLASSSAQSPTLEDRGPPRVRRPALMAPRRASTLGTQCTIALL